MLMLKKMCQSIRWAFNWKEWNPTEQEFVYAVSCIQLEEKDKLARFVFRKDIRASLAGRLLMRKFVHEYGNIPYNNITFTRDINNKPILGNDPSKLSFNVSHQGDYTVLAGEMKNVKLGVDVMKLEYTGGKQLSEFFRIMNRNFTASEWREIKHYSLDEFGQISMFCRHWALKESYVKAVGVGITMDLRSIDFRTNSKLAENSVTIDTVLYMNGIKQDWLFEETLLNSQHCVAVALQENGKAPISERSVFNLVDSKNLLVGSIPIHPQDFHYAKNYFMKEECAG